MCGLDLAEWLERLTANAEAETVLGSIPTFSDTLESEGRTTKKCSIKYNEKKSYKIPFDRHYCVIDPARVTSA